MAPAASPCRSIYKLQASVLSEVKSFSPASLRHVPRIRVTDASGAVREEPWQELQRPDEVKAAALRAVAAARARGKDSLPCRIAEGLFIGGAGAARNLKALRKRGITAIVNAAPSVPCHFKDCPEDEFTYLALPLFDDPDADLAPHIEAANAFISAARARGAGVLVHCYAGQSRSAALVMAFLMASQGLGMMEAWAATRAARPCAQPNAGFLRQLARYSKSLSCGAAAAAIAAPRAAIEEVDAAAVEPLPLTQ
ncbi:hypothetical protein ABPG75_009370 [Micractinium tetrahymenae]